MSSSLAFSLLHEKNELEKKLEDDKKYIFKLERKLLEWAKKKGIVNLRDISLDRSEWSRMETTKHYDFQSGTHMKGGKDLETIISDQAYEIQVLRAALVQRLKSTDDKPF